MGNPKKNSTKNNITANAKQLPAQKPTPEYSDDFQQIEKAVLETKRGRWFLGEYARKNRVVESQKVLDAIKSIEDKLSPPKITTTPKLKKPSVEVPQTSFENKQQSSYFSQLFFEFKQKTVESLKWAGIKHPISFAKIQTIIGFAKTQTLSNLSKQQKTLDAIATQLQEQGVDQKIINKMLQVKSELSKLETLQANLNIQLEDGFEFLSQVEKTINLAPENLKTIEKTPEKVQKSIEKSQKLPEKPRKEQEIEQKTTKLGPAGRIKKMFRIEQTLKEQPNRTTQAEQDFDAAFTNEKLKIEQSNRHLSTPENIQKDLQSTKIAKQSQKLTDISKQMKTEIIIEDDFNALNSLALLSKTERTMLFTLQN